MAQTENINENNPSPEEKEKATVTPQEPETPDKPVTPDTADAGAEKDSDTEDAAGTEKFSFGDKKKLKKLEAKINELDKKLADAAAAAVEKDDKYLRLCAEYDNFRRRAAKEKEGIYADAYSSAMNSLLPVMDNLYRAVGCEDAKALLDGLALTLKSFNEALSKLGIEEIKAEGQKFDPNLHYAVLHVDDESLGEGEIVEVLQRGYIKGDKVIRYAVVKVAN